VCRPCADIHGPGPAGYEAHGQPPATPRAWHRHFPPSHGPRGPEEAPDLAHHQEWTVGMQRLKLEDGLCAAAQAAGKRDQEK
jgi:hypothetical protein